ncbi:MAG: hypothetical protein ACK5ME_10965 [Parahaliea sp.]
MIRILLFIHGFFFANILVAASDCPSDEVAAVEQVMQYSTVDVSGGKSLDIRSEGRGEIKHYVSVTGSTYQQNSGETLIPSGMDDSGNFIYRWLPLEVDIWERGENIYRSTRREGKEAHRRKNRTIDKDFNPLVAIEDVSSKMPDTDIVAGHRCRLSQQAVGEDGSMSVCNLEIYGLNTPLESRISYKNGSRQTFVTTSLKELCLEKSRFEVPEREWE